MRPPFVSSTASSLQRTIVYDLYWRFAAERQAVFFRRLEGVSQWTSDTILQNYKFTNVYRASDRVSQYLIRNVIYDERYLATSTEIVFRILLFKLFNKISTWELLESHLGPLTWKGFDAAGYDRILTAAMARGTKLYSAAYIIPPVSLDQSKVKHRGHLKLIDLIMSGTFVSRLERTPDLRAVFSLLKQFPSLGDFLALQFAIDLNYSTVINHNEASFVVAGPGARDGLAKTFVGASTVSAEHLISMMMERQEEEFSCRGLNFRSLWGRPLQLIDCQNLFCEISKYTRISHPEIAGLFGRKRIKQMFRPQHLPIQPWYPPKWGINGRIPIYDANLAEASTGAA